MHNKTEPQLNATHKRKRPLDDILPEGDLCVMLGLTSGTLWEWRRNYGLPYIPIGKSVFYSESAFVKWCKGREITYGNGHSSEGVITSD